MRWHLIPDSMEGIIHYREDSRKECNLAEIVIAESHPYLPPPLAPARGRRGAKRRILVAFEYQIVATIASRGQGRETGMYPI